jgi:hypothetical protein
MLNIVSGKMKKPVKMTLYGVEGVGKTTFASKFPRPLFIDAEAGTRRIDVDRIYVSNWTECLSVLRQLMNYKNQYDTIVLDTLDALEYLAIQSVCDRFKIPALGGNNDYGKSYSALASEFGEMIAELNALNDAGFHIVCLAHAQVVRVETIGEDGAYDRYQLKLEKKTSAKIKEWTEFLAFMNFETKVIEQKGKKNKAVGGERIAYCEHSLYWDAKNRDTDSIPLKFSIEMRDGKHIGWETIRKHVEKNTLNQGKKGESNYDVEEERESVRQLKAVLEANDMTMDEAMECIYSHKHYVPGTPLENIDDEYITGKLIPAIPKLKRKTN